MVDHSPPKAKVVGSNPAGCTSFPDILRIEKGDFLLPNLFARSLLSSNPPDDKISAIFVVNER